TLCVSAVQVSDTSLGSRYNWLQECRLCESRDLLRYAPPGRRVRARISAGGRVIRNSGPEADGRHPTAAIIVFWPAALRVSGRRCSDSRTGKARYAENRSIETQRYSSHRCQTENMTQFLDVGHEGIAHEAYVLNRTLSGTFVTVPAGVFDDNRYPAQVSAVAHGPSGHKAIAR